MYLCILWISSFRVSVSLSAKKIMAEFGDLSDLVFALKAANYTRVAVQVRDDELDSARTSSLPCKRNYRTHSFRSLVILSQTVALMKSQLNTMDQTVSLSSDTPVGSLPSAW